MSSKRELTILFAPLCYVGEMMSSVGIGEVLRNAGHRCVYAVTGDWRSRLESMGFEVRLKGQLTDTEPVADSADDNVKIALDAGLLDDKTPLEKAIDCNNFNMQLLFDEEVNTEPYLKAIIADLRPDLIITDHLIALPSIVTSGIPWIFSWSSNPLGLDTGFADPSLPPSMLGLPTNSSEEKIQKYRQLINDGKRELWFKYRDRLTASGCPEVKDFLLWTPSPFANIYITPLELDYTDVRPLPDTFHGFDYYKRSGDQELAFELPAKLANRSGKLVYLSLGSMGGGNVALMKRLVAILAKSRHRFIVSKGVKHNEYELSANMWGERTVPQLRVLPMCDAVVTHGGNNTVTETMYFGKPMVIMPLFADQYDNAQRVMEKGFGLRVDAWKCSEEELLQSIDSVLKNTVMAEKCAKASLRIQTERRIEKLVDLVHSLVKL